MRVDSARRGFDVFIGEGLRFPSDLVFTEDGHLFVTSAFTRQVLEYNGRTAARIREFHIMPEGSAPVGLDIALDGDIIVGDFAGNRILKIDRHDGTVVEMTSGLAGPENVVVKRR